MKAYRYNAEKREDRSFNNCGEEKNPNMVKFYATNLKYAEKYKTIFNDEGFELYDCELEVIEIEGVNLFDMATNFATTEVYKTYINETIEEQRRNYTIYLNEAKTKKDVKLWKFQLENLKNREEELVKNLKYNEFQQLSDFEYQNILVEELKAKGFDGYFTANEIAIF